MITKLCDILKNLFPNTSFEFNKKEIDFYKNPILAKAEKVKDKYVWFHTAQKDETPEQFLHRIYEGSDCHMDCSIFAQIVTIANEEWGDVLKYGGKFSLTLTKDEFSSFFLNHDKSKNMLYIQPSNEEVRNFLQGVPCVCKGQWVIGDGNSKEYLGLSLDGPKILPFDGWTSLLMEGIKEYIGDLKTKNIPRIGSSVDIDHIHRSILNCHLKMGKLEKWEFQKVDSILPAY